MISRLAGLSSLGIGTFLAQTGTRFNNSVTTGSIILAAVVMVAAGLFTIRSHVAQTWQRSWEAEKALRQEKEAELAKTGGQLLDERAEQQQLRHELKNELAIARGQIVLLESKTDLSALEQTATTRHTEILAAIQAQTAVLNTIAERLSPPLLTERTT